MSDSSQLQWWAQVGSRQSFEEERRQKFIKALVRRAEWRADDKATRLAVRFDVLGPFTQALLESHRKFKETI